MILLMLFEYYYVIFSPWFACLWSWSPSVLTTANSSVSQSNCFPLHSWMEKAMAPHSSTLAWQIPWTEEPGGLQSMGSLRVGHDWATPLSLSCIGEGNGSPLQCSCLENPRDGGVWWAAVYGVAQSQTRLKWLSSSSSSRYKIMRHKKKKNHKSYCDSTSWTKPRSALSCCFFILGLASTGCYSP